MINIENVRFIGRSNGIVLERSKVVPESTSSNLPEQCGQWWHLLRTSMTRRLLEFCRLPWIIYCEVVTLFMHTVFAFIGVEVLHQCYSFQLWLALGTRWGSTFVGVLWLRSDACSQQLTVWKKTSSFMSILTTLMMMRRRQEFRCTIIEDAMWKCRIVVKCFISFKAILVR